MFQFLTQLFDSLSLIVGILHAFYNSFQMSFDSLRVFSDSSQPVSFSPNKAGVMKPHWFVSALEPQYIATFDRVRSTLQCYWANWPMSFLSMLETPRLQGGPM